MVVRNCLNMAMGGSPKYSSSPCSFPRTPRSLISLPLPLLLSSNSIFSSPEDVEGEKISRWFVLSLSSHKNSRGTSAPLILNKWDSLWRLLLLFFQAGDELRLDQNLHFTLLPLSPNFFPPFFLIFFSYSLTLRSQHFFLLSPCTLSPGL